MRFIYVSVPCYVMAYIAYYTQRRSLSPVREPHFERSNDYRCDASVPESSVFTKRKQNI